MLFDQENGYYYNMHSRVGSRTVTNYNAFFQMLTNMSSFMHEKTCLILIYSSLAGAPVSIEAKDVSYLQLHLSWQPPQKGYIPTHYILEKREAGSLIWVRIDMIPAKENTEYKVKGLKAGTWYSFRVIAKFVKGKSRPCETESPTQTKPIRSK